MITSAAQEGVGDDDVLCGRGGGTNHHIGNVRFRALVAAHQRKYLAAKRADKERIAQDIVKIIQGRGGRYLQKDESGTWQQVDDKKAIAKSCQALREGLDVRNKSFKFPSDSGESPTAAAREESSPTRDPATSPIASQPIVMSIVGTNNSTFKSISCQKENTDTNEGKSTSYQKENTEANESNSQDQRGIYDDATNGNTEQDGVQWNDVLCGRGGYTNSHAGNVRFRAVVASYQSQYLTAKKREKEGIARDVVQTIRERGGRFLQKNDAGSWEEVDEKKAILKSSQALREGLDAHKRTLLSPEAAASKVVEASLSMADKKHPAAKSVDEVASAQLPPKRRKLDAVISKLPVMSRKVLETVARLALEATTDEAIDEVATVIINASG